jgi:hypothetical protein
MAIANGNFNRVPVINGGTHDEATLFVFGAYAAAGRPVTPAEYERSIRATFGVNADRVLREYPISAYPSPSMAFATVWSDAGIKPPWSPSFIVGAYPRHVIDRQLSRYVPVYSYEHDLDHRFVRGDLQSRLVRREGLEGGEPGVEQGRRHELVGSLPHPPTSSTGETSSCTMKASGRPACSRWRYRRRSAEQATTTSPVAAASATTSSHGIRSESSSGRPAAIFALFAAGCRSSASTKDRPSRSATAEPVADLPAPDTPVTMTARGTAVKARPVRRCPQ